MIGHHVTIRLRSSRVIAPTAEARLRARAVVTRLAGITPLLTWSLVDDHGHFVTTADRPESGQIARRLELGLVRALGLGEGFEAARIRPIADQRHLRNAAWYALRQAEHHGLAGAEAMDPWQDLSVLPGLLGMRWPVSPCVARVRQHLPRTRRAELLEVLGWDGVVPEGLGAQREHLAPLVEAACGVVGVGCLASKRPAVVQVRRAVLALAPADTEAQALAAAMGVHRSTLPRLRRRPVEEEVVRALRAQWAWRVAVAARGRTAPW